MTFSVLRRNNQNDVWTQYVYVSLTLTEVLIKIGRTAANIRINLISPESRVHAEYFAADSMGRLLLVFTQLFSKSTQNQF